MRAVHHLAQCMTCGKVWGTRNALGVAVQHSRKYGHEVAVEIMMSGRWINGVRK